MAAPDDPLVLGPRFKIVFGCVMALTLISLTASICLAIFVTNQSPEVKGLIETCSTTDKLGFGAIVGLIGGKAL